MWHISFERLQPFTSWHQRTKCDSKELLCAQIKMQFLWQPARHCGAGDLPCDTKGAHWPKHGFSLQHTPQYPHTSIPYSLKEFGQILTLEGGPSISVFGLTPHYSRIWLIYRVWWSCSLHELIPFSWSNPRPSGAHVSGAQQEEEDDWGQRSMRSLSLNESTHKPAAGHPEGNDIINIKIIADSAHFYHLVSPERSNNKSIKLQSHTSTFATLVAPVSQFSQLCTGCNVIFLISNDDISLTIEKCQYISEYLSIWSVPSYFNSSMHSSWNGLNTFV